MTQPAPRRFTFGGEFRKSTREAAYRRDRLPEARRHARLAFLFGLVINGLFLISDFRFLGHPHLYAALTARAVMLVTCLAGLLLAPRVPTDKRLRQLCLAWSAPAIAACAVLVTPQSDAALLVTFLLPVIFYLALSLPFAWAVTTGLVCNLACLVAHSLGAANLATLPGLLLGSATLNGVLALVLIRVNRLLRMNWAHALTARATARQIAQQRRIIESLFEAVPTPVVLVSADGKRLLRANGAARDSLGLPDGPQCQPVTPLLAVKDLAGLKRRLRDGATLEKCEARLQLPDGSLRDVLLSATPVRSGDEEAILAVLMDISRQKRIEAHLERRANTDSLTGLATRGCFFDKAARLIPRATAAGQAVAVVMLDVDHFKEVNDTYGHGTGDTVLSAVATTCRGLMRGRDTAARLGGEEFALLLPETDLAGASALTERLRQAVADLEDRGLPCPVTVSAGVSALRPGELSIEAALARADQALYAAKKAGRNQVAVCTAETQESAARWPARSK